MPGLSEQYAPGSNSTKERFVLLDQTLTPQDLSDVSAAIVSAPLVELRLGTPNPDAYLGEVYESWPAVQVDKSIFRISGKSSSVAGRTSEFWGTTALRIDMADDTGVVANTAPYLYGARIRVAPRVGRTLSAVDDVVGVIVSNKSYGDYGTTFSGTEAFYVGSGNDPSPNVEWKSGYAVDCPTTRAFVVSKNCDYGLLITANVVVGQAAVAIPNASKISWRNQLDNAWLECLKLDASNVLVVGGGPGKVAVGTPVGTVSTHLEVHGAGVADGATLLPQVRIVDTTAFAANVGGEIILGGLTDAVPTYRSFAAIKSGKANATSGNGAGYLAFWSRNASTGLLEVLRLTELQMLQVAEASDFIFGTTTGTRLGTAATQKIGFWNATPVIQSTGWGTVTGTLAKTTFVADSVTLPNLAARVGQLINDLKTYGILGG